jgi:antitoxin CcdA
MTAAARRLPAVPSAKRTRAPRRPVSRPPSPRSPSPRAGASRARKAPTNLSLRIDLVQRAKGLGLNLSEVVEEALEKAIREAEQARWLAENKDAIEQYNAFVEEHGYFGEEFRDF